MSAISPALREYFTNTLFKGNRTVGYEFLNRMEDPCSSSDPLSPDLTRAIKLVFGNEIGMALIQTIQDYPLTTPPRNLPVIDKSIFYFFPKEHWLEMTRLINRTCAAPESPFSMLFDDILNVPVADPTDVAEWNTFFSTSGTAFTSVVVNGNTVELYGASNTGLDLTGFIGSTSILAIDDQSDQITSISQMGGATALLAVNLPAVTSIPDNAFNGCTSLSDAQIGSATSIGAASFKDCQSLISISGPVCLTLGNEAFGNCFSLMDADFRIATTLGDDCFDSCPLTGTTDFTEVTTIGNECFNSCGFSTITLDNLTTITGGNTFAANTALTDLSLPAIDIIPDTICFGCTSLSTFSAAIAAIVGVTAGSAGCFDGCVSLTLVDIPLCIDLGGSAGDDFVFNNIAGITATINIAASQATIDGGNPDGDLVAFLAANPASTINYI